MSISLQPCASRSSTTFFSLALASPCGLTMNSFAVPSPSASISACIEEDRPTDVYALTVKRTTKLKDAAPNRRSECHIAYGDANLTMTCQNTTMRQLQDRARDQAWGTLDRPVLDQTGLRGAYDFSITWVPGPWNSQQPAAPAEGMASAPTGEISFFEAMEKQLGLKLTKQKLPYPALVVDSVELPKDQ